MVASLFFYAIEFFTDFLVDLNSSKWLNSRHRTSLDYFPDNVFTTKEVIDSARNRFSIGRINI